MTMKRQLAVIVSASSYVIYLRAALCKPDCLSPSYMCCSADPLKPVFINPSPTALDSNKGGKCAEMRNITRYQCIARQLTCFFIYNIARPLVFAISST
jgi:hypothetical protein